MSRLNMAQRDPDRPDNGHPLPCRGYYLHVWHPTFIDEWACTCKPAVVAEAR